MHPCVIMRSRNEMPVLRETLHMLCRQTQPFELVAFDNASTDGSVEEIRKHTDRIVHVPAGEYVPGRVLNRGMEASSGELVVFLNADCTPQGETWLAALLGGFDSDQVAAVFGRQVPRNGCRPLHARDVELTFGDGARQASWRHCFSMASSAIRRSAWQEMMFSEELQYSEDIDWTWRARQRGWVVRYVPEAAAAHSENYSLGKFYRRHYGEGKAESRIFDWSPWQRNVLRYSLLPYARQVCGDWRYCLRRLAIGSAAYSPVLRFAQLLGRRAGFRAGWRERVA